MFHALSRAGLDSASAFFCVNALKTLAGKERSIVMSIEQPSAEVYALFDRVLLLSGGKPIFFGAASRSASSLPSLVADVPVLLVRSACCNG